MLPRSAAPRVVLLVCASFSLCAQEGSSPPPAHVETNGFLSHVWLSGQANFILQAHPDFRSPTEGPNSFRPVTEVDVSRIVTLYTGLKLNESTDLYFDVEASSGHNVSAALGLGAFTDADVAGAPSDQPYIARAMIHHTIPFSNDLIETGRGPLQFSSRVPVRRLEIYLGKMSLVDFFDINAVGGDTHLQFMNWAIDNDAAYNYPADQRGYTYGAVFDFQDRLWGVRFGEALVPKITSDNLARGHFENVEFELHSGFLPRRRGFLRALGFVINSKPGSYRDAVNGYLDGATPTPEIADYRASGRPKYGFSGNFEQELPKNFRAYGRFGWNEGHYESTEFAEVNQSASGGTDLQGDVWHRPDDKFGAAFVSSALSGDHRRYLELGGVGLWLGDGSLNYGRENIVETYYTAKLRRGVWASVDLQRVWNPGFNHNRGPAFVASFRLHLEGAIFDNPR